MKVVKLQLATRTLLNPAARQWEKAPLEEVSLAGTPLHLQPTRYIRAAWAGKPIGAVRFLKVQAAHNHNDIAFRLQWDDVSENRDHGDGSVFPDAAAVLFPLSQDTPLESMGSAKAPLNAWLWRANLPDGEAEHLTFQGIGTEEPSAKTSLQARALWADGRWQLVIARPLAAADGVRLSPGNPARVAFAVWEGSHQERAGINSFSKHWRQLDIQ